MRVKFQHAHGRVFTQFLRYFSPELTFSFIGLRHLLSKLLAFASGNAKMAAQNNDCPGLAGDRQVRGVEIT